MAELTQPAVVVSALDLTPHVRQLILRPLRQKIVFQPGQWVSLKLPVGAKQPLNRAYSMAAPASPDGELTLVFDRVPDGIGSDYLYQLKPGDEVPISGPYGNFVLPAPLDRELLFVARYTGLVPIRCLLKQLAATRMDVSVLLLAVAPSEQELLFHHELLAMAVQFPFFRYLPLVIPGGETEAVERTLAMLRPLVDGQPKVIPMISGTKGFVRPVRAGLMECGYDRKEVKTETFD